MRDCRRPNDAPERNAQSGWLRRQAVEPTTLEPIGRNHRLLHRCQAAASGTTAMDQRHYNQLVAQVLSSTWHCDCGTKGAGARSSTDDTIWRCGCRTAGPTCRASYTISTCHPRLLRLFLYIRRPIEYTIHNVIGRDVMCNCEKL